MDTNAKPQDTVQLTPRQIEEIADRNGEIIQGEIIKSTFQTRTQGFWAGSGLGLLYGGLMGTLVALSTVFVGVPLFAVAGAASVMSMLPIVAGTFAVAGMALGATIMTAVNASGGAAHGQVKVNDRRQLTQHPDEKTAEALRYHGTPKGKDTFWNKIVPFSKGSKEPFSFRNALIFGAFGLVACALFLYVAPVLGGGIGILHATASGLLAHAPVVAAVIAKYSATEACMAYATCGLFGATFGFDGPTIAANSTKFVADIFGGKILGFGKSRSVELEKTPVQAPACGCPHARETVTPEEAAVLESRLAAKKDFAKAITTQQMQPASSGIQV